MLFCFFMDCVFVAAGAIFFIFNTIGLFFLVLRG
jgi:hypothetical protein